MFNYFTSIHNALFFPSSHSGHFTAFFFNGECTDDSVMNHDIPSRMNLLRVMSDWVRCGSSVLIGLVKQTYEERVLRNAEREIWTRIMITPSEKTSGKSVRIRLINRRLRFQHLLKPSTITVIPYHVYIARRFI